MRRLAIILLLELVLLAGVLAVIRRDCAPGHGGCGTAGRRSETGSNRL